MDDQMASQILKALAESELKQIQIALEMSSDLTSVGKQLAADDKASVATMVAGEGILPYEVPTEVDASAATAVASVTSEADDAEDTRTEADSKDDPKFKYHNKKSLLIQDVMVTLAGAERAAGLSLITLCALSQDNILKEYLKNKPDLIKTLNDAQFGIKDFLLFIHHQNLDATIQWQPHMEFVLRTLQKCGEEAEKKPSAEAQ